MSADEHVAVMVMEDTGEEVLRMRVPAGYTFAYICPIRHGIYRLYIVPEWGDNIDKAIDVYGPWPMQPAKMSYYAPPAERKNWGAIE